MDRPSDALVVPIRSFVRGKARLAEVLDDVARHDLVARMAARVLDASGTLTTVVVTNDSEVATFARAHGATVIDDPGTLDGAADAGREWARARGATRVVIAHADLPHAHGLDALGATGAQRVAVLVPDRHDDGTPVLSIPVDAPFEFAYGPGSFARHCAAAAAADLEVRVLRDAALGFDIDEPADLAALDALTPCPGPTAGDTSGR